MVMAANHRSVPTAAKGATPKNNRGQTTVSSLLESFRRQPLGNGAYLHLGKPDEEEVVITVTGVPEVGMAGINVLLAG